MNVARAIFGPNSMTSNTQTSSAPNSGTLGGRRLTMGAKPGMNFAIGDEGYLWILMILEVLAMGLLRKKFKRYHGG
jgi:hypothetical protein